MGEFGVKRMHTKTISSDMYETYGGIKIFNVLCVPPVGLLVECPQAVPQRERTTRTSQAAGFLELLNDPEESLGGGSTPDERMKDAGGAEI
eukprot:scaffold104507_cov28-Prasinocladus_malaysianus.AAC.2